MPLLTILHRAAPLFGTLILAASGTKLHRMYTKIGLQEQERGQEQARNHLNTTAEEVREQKGVDGKVVLAAVKRTRESEKVRKRDLGLRMWGVEYKREIERKLDSERVRSMKAEKHWDGEAWVEWEKVREGILRGRK